MISNLILEAFKDKFSLFVLVFPDPIFSFELIVLNGFRIIKVDILGMEHMGAEIQYCPFVDFGSFVFRCVDLRVVLNEIADSLYEIAIFFLGLEELLFGKIRKTNKEMHENGNLQICLF